MPVLSPNQQLPSHLSHEFVIAKEERFDRVTRLAAAFFQVPFALIHIAEAGELWVKSAVGASLSLTPSDAPLCQIVITQDAPLVITDAQADPAYAHYPMVNNPPFIRFYAGVPLHTAEGAPIGSLCILDTEPRCFSEAQLVHLVDFAAYAEHELNRFQLQELIEQQQATEKLLRESEARAREVFDALAEGVILQDPQGKIMSANASAERILGISSEYLQERGSFSPTWELFAEDGSHFPHEKLPALLALRTGVPQTEVVIGLARPDGSRIWLSMHSRPLFAEDGKRTLAVVTSFADITIHKQAERQLKAYQHQLEDYNTALAELAMTDGLTGIINKRMLLEFMEMEVERAMMMNKPLSFILLDVDHFKTFNDTYGHPAGDVVLQQVAQLLREEARTHDRVARYGGEEFAVVALNAPLAGATSLAERLRRRIEAFHWAHRPITASFGVATIDERVCSSTLLIEAADKALYEAKKHGRNCVVPMPQPELDF